MHKITRISYNSGGWQKPTGEARDYEEPGTYNHEHGFGHEDWLFRSEWLIDGWRYSFLQGVNKSHAKLVKAGQPVDLTLFTIQPDKKRRYVATIDAVECLDDVQAEQALEAFGRRGWLAAMEQEIMTIGGIHTALGAANWAKHVLNVRFRLENVTLFPPTTYTESDDPVNGLNRYMLYDSAKIGLSAKSRAPLVQGGSLDLPSIIPFQRRAVAATECTPEHARMQAKLMLELQAEYPNTKVVRERDFIDLRVETGEEVLLFEIKSDLDPRTVIRQGLGQILEYAYHPRRQHPVQTLKLVLVGRRPLSEADTAYMNRLREDFNLPINYRVVSI